MKIMDWALIAAREIVEMVPPADALPTYKAIFVYNIIRTHCPFEPDVAYMPVPRCDSCAHWIPVKHLEHTWSACEELSTGRVASTEGDDVIQTRADFGCVQWKAKS